MFQRLHRLLPEALPLLRCPGAGPVARRVDLLLHAALARIDELATLATYADPDTPDAQAQDADAVSCDGPSLELTV